MSANAESEAQEGGTYGMKKLAGSNKSWGAGEKCRDFWCLTSIFNRSWNISRL